MADADSDAVAQARSDGTRLASTDLDELMDRLSPTVTLAVIEEQAGQLVMLHACAVADPASGRTVALVGPSGAGKTTAAMRLGEQFGYVTDETLGVLPDGRVVAYPKPLSVLRSHDGSGLKDQVSPVDLGLLPIPDETHLVKILMLDRRPEAPRTPQLADVPTLLAMTELSPQISFLTRLDRPLHRLGDHLRDTGGLQRVSFDGSESLAPVVAAVMEAAAC